MKKKELIHRWIALAMISVLMLTAWPAVLEESYSASVMRLLNYEGEVYILDALGNTRFLMENIRFGSGESLSTGANAMASVSLDTARILTLDSMTQVTFAKENNRMTLTLSSGRLLLDVQEKLDENESFDIQTSTMTVGIRGTVVYLTSFDGSEEEINKVLLESNKSFRELLNRTLPDNYSGNFSQLIVLEGTAVATFEDASGQIQSVAVHAGEKITVMDDQRDGGSVSQATGSDLGQDMIEFIQDDPVLSEKVEQASDILTDTNQQDETALPEEKEPVISDDTPPEHVHNFSSEVIPPTCTSDGEIKYVCACGETFSAAGDEALGHDWGPWRVVREATAEQDGVEVSSCSRCGEIQSVIIPKLDPTPTPEPSPTPHVHTPITEDAIAATCTESGWTEHIYCAVCEEVLEPYQTEIPALGHDWGAWETVEDATCGVAGLKRRTCQRCGATEEESIPATGAHVTPEEPTIENEVAETCTTGESFDEVMYCTICGAELSRQPYATDAPGHVWGEWETVTEATCTEDGLKQRTCQRSGCGQVEQETIPALEHDWVDEVLVEASCDHGGSGTSTCSRCGETMEWESLDLGGHLPVAVELPTCTDAGYTGRTRCSRCGELIDEGTPAPALGGEHNYVQQDGTTSRTVVSSNGKLIVQVLGYMVCSRCGDGYTVVLDSWEEDAHSICAHTPVETGKPTCTDAGYEGRTICTKCGAVIDEGTPAPALGGEHNFQQQGDIGSSSYVNSDGDTIYFTYRYMVCTRCGYGYTETLEEWQDGNHALYPSETSTP